MEILVPDTDAGEFEARLCAAKMERFIKSEGQVAAIMGLRPDDRQCVAAQLSAYCWKTDLAKADDDRRREEIAAVLQQVEKFVLYACRNTRSPKPTVDKVVGAVTRGWDIIAMQQEQSATRRKRR